MRTWNGIGSGFGARLAGIALLAAALAGGNALPAAADPASTTPTPQAGTAQARTAHHGVTVVTLVRARDLMTPEEQRVYRRAWREARTAEDRQRLHQATVERLQQRAAEHGIVMVIETRVLRPNRRTTAAEATPAPARTAATPAAPAPVAAAPVAAAPVAVAPAAAPAARPLPPRAP